MTPADAIAALTPAESRRLASYARQRAKRGYSGDADDLLQDALTATLEGSRTWNREKVDLVGHLCGVMRSLSSHFWSSLCGQNPAAELDDRDAAEEPMAERALIAREEARELREMFRGDRDALLVLDLMAKGEKGPAIKERLGLTQNELETITRRVRRRAVGRNDRPKRENDVATGKAEELFLKVLAEARKANAAGETPMPNIASLLLRTGNTYGFGPASVWAKRNAPDDYAELYRLVGRAPPEKKPKREPAPVQVVNVVNEASEVEPEEEAEEEATPAPPTKAEVLANCIAWLEHLDHDDRVKVLTSTAVYFGVKGAFFLLESVCGGKEMAR